MAGWIKIDRSIREHWIWKDPVKLKWWLDILMEVNYDDNKVPIKFKIIECGRGQSVMSLLEWSKRWNVSKTVVRNFFTMLENDNMIRTENVTVSTRITVCNYDTYQQIENAFKTQSKRNRNATETQQYTTKEYKEIKESKEGEEQQQAGVVETWRSDFQIYLSELRVAYLELINNREWMAEKQTFHPGVNIRLSLEKACKEFWATNEGWEHKKKSKSKTNDWKSTLTKSLSQKQNKVYEQQTSKSGFARAGYDPNNGIGTGERLSDKKRPVIFSAESLRDMSGLQSERTE